MAYLITDRLNRHINENMSVKGAVGESGRGEERGREWESVGERVGEGKREWEREGVCVHV